MSFMILSQSKQIEISYFSSREANLSSLYLINYTLINVDRD